jgi:hypothetical protein
MLQEVVAQAPIAPVPFGREDGTFDHTSLDYHYCPSEVQNRKNSNTHNLNAYNRLVKGFWEPIEVFRAAFGGALSESERHLRTSSITGADFAPQTAVVL